MTKKAQSHDAPLRLWEGEVLPAWIDANGHLNDGYYAVAFSDATWRVQDYLGMDAHYRAKTGGTLYSVEAHFTWERELLLGQRIHTESLILGADEKRLRLFQFLLASDENMVAATMDLMLLHVIQHEGSVRVSPFPPEISARVQEVAAAHINLDRPVQAGRKIRDL
ncbi:thioesterase family protein [Thioalkalivibrio sp. HK1]|uniref:thioesterase family protein n=1 Tax=Thioalkalivibrio sp. HK1 TaxID=1469245 RepID=UPI00047130E4|nr:thioesterase family protein [Thioalkalivibrio sp. HK1]